ncbi:hypothetical protein JQX13_01375 [Archangium violaceum]|uniref:hypothetical protein n=1 Tax=Archangium violaceum TaxID=83451 RepID=UPI00193B6059|nr:hypothetical protein [Archangium violaceum]QRK08852.1 hypothetical protein JQX13_01375 [Archangium violaceum]
MKNEKNEKKTKAIKELFIQDLARLQGGRGYTPAENVKATSTLACGEEPGGCDPL